MNQQRAKFKVVNYQLFTGAVVFLSALGIQTFAQDSTKVPDPAVQSQVETSTQSPKQLEVNASPNTLTKKTQADVEEISLDEPVQTVNAEVMKLSLNDLLSMKLSTGSFLELDIAKSPLSMTIINKNMIKTSGARNLSELLEIYVPGFYYAFNKWNGTVWGMRGVINDRNTKIIVLANGHKLNGQARDGFNFEQTLGLLGDIDHIEVLRGPAGLVYGSGAIAGIINMVSRKGDQQSNASVSYNTGHDLVVDGMVNGSPAKDQTVNISFGVLKSKGLGTGKSRIYGGPQWPFANWVADSLLPTQGGVPTDGSYGYTPGNYRLSVGWDWKNFSFYSRFTRQEESAGGLFIYSPWPDNNGSPDSTTPNVTIDGKSVPYNDPFWSQVEAGGAQRHQYLNQNFSSEATYKLQLKDNEVQFKAGFDKTSNMIYTGTPEAYSDEYKYRQTDHINEAFGEERYSVGATYLLKSIDKLQLAIGTDFRLDKFGDDYYGHDAADGKENKPIIHKINYTNLALFSEGYYELTSKIGFDAGIRYDKHTRADMFNGKLAGIFTPLKGQTLKLIFQTSSNNGSVDNYEYNRVNYDADGNLITKVYYKDTITTSKVRDLTYAPVVSESELRSLKPERVYNYEVTTTHQFKDFILSPSFTYGVIKDLFAWTDPLARVINTYGYDYINLDIDAKYNNKYVPIGVNYTFQRPVNTDTSISKLFVKPYIETYDSFTVNNVKYYRNKLSTTDFDTVDVSIVKDNITRDGKNFILLPKHMMKFYIDIKPSNWLTLHSDCRVFWGWEGRAARFGSDDSVFQIFDLNDNNPMHSIKKLDVSALIQIPSGFEVSLYAYNILGVYNGYSGWDQHDPILGGDVRNAMRPGVELNATDFREFGIKITKSF